MLRVFTYRRSATEPPSSGEAPDPFGPWFEAHPYAKRSLDFSDPGVSGLTSPPRRAGFGALLVAAEQDPPDFVLVRGPADLGRDVGASVLARQLLDQRGVDLLFVEVGRADAHPDGAES